MRNLLLPAVLFAVTAAGCQSAYISAMNAFGVETREILVDRVIAARDDQVEAKEQIKTTFEAFQELTGFQGGDLEDLYKKLKDEYDDSEDAAEDVSDRIDKVEAAAKAMFSDWDEEIAGMAAADLRRQSETMRRDTETRYNEVLRVMRRSEAKMKPVLQSFSDHVMLLKHSLNAAAISSLKNTAVEIEGNVADLIQSMESSIDEADEFLKELGSEQS